ncbi:MAG: ANTAR domain-containing protein [Treponema sp.]|jgi:response regulator NasT|nr:ANTAR domain-containing protein [Treponema sp.]
MHGTAMENALIVSDSEKDAALYTGFLSAASIHQITSLQSCDSARRLIQKQDFDVIIVDSPLGDEAGEMFSRHTASKGISQVILLVNSELFASVSAACEDDGVLTISKPLNRELFWSALSLAKSVQNRVKRMQAENTQLKQKIEDIRIIDRAKWILISSMKMSEQEAHRYIEKQAMDMRSSRRIIAEGILKKYEN